MHLLNGLLQISNSHQYSWLRLKSEVTQRKCQESPGLHLDCDVFIVLSTKFTLNNKDQYPNIFGDLNSLV